MEGFVRKASKLWSYPTDSGWSFSSEHHRIKSAFGENILAMAQIMSWRRGTGAEEGESVEEGELRQETLQERAETLRAEEKGRVA